MSDASLLKPVSDDKRLRGIVKAITEVDNQEFAARANAAEFHALSSNTEFEAMEVSPEAVFETGDGSFKASAIVYATLHYGGKKDHVSMPDSYPAVVEGRIEPNGGASVERIEVDTSSFYE